MKQQTNQFQAWGKLARDGQDCVIGEHPLLDHMIDVASCFLALSACKGVRRALEKTAGRTLDKADMERLAVLVFLHDIGKANAGFQSRRWLSPPSYWTVRNPSGHGVEGLDLLFCHREPFTSGLPIAKICEWGDGAVVELLRASISHHGRPLVEGITAKDIWKPVFEQGVERYNPATTLASMGTVLQRSYPLAFEKCCQPLPDKPAFVHLFAGLVQLADWLGSDTREGFFPYSLPGEERSETAPKRSANAVQAIGLDVSQWLEAITQRNPTFSNVFNVPTARPMQLQLSTSSLGQLAILEAETGSGKTEAALWHFVRLFQEGKVDSLYFALPTRVAASQIYQRTRKAVERIWPKNAPVVVRALPGDEAADDHKKVRLPDFKVQWPDHPDDIRAHRRWAAESPKRLLAATIAVGTIDQALLGALKVRHAHMRHAMLTRSLLVVDEVHASDTYMTVLLEQLLRAHLHAGAHALLLSATLGCVARTRYLNLGKTQNIALPSLTEATAIAYPLISHRDDSGMHMIPAEGSPHNKEVHWKTIDAMDEPPCIADLAAQAAAQGARVLIVRNTVASAIATQHALEDLAQKSQALWLFQVNGVSTLHHSRFSANDRLLLNQAVESQLGKERAGIQGRVVVGTQTLEQSLDIDADLLITDLCPMDVLLQRVGRLHRHVRAASERPVAYQQANAWVLTPKDNNLAPLLKRSRNGLGMLREGVGIYPDLRIAETTRRLIDAESVRSIPKENRFLVEQATHPEALLAIEKELGHEWEKLGQQLEGSISAGKGMGNLHTLPFNNAFSELRYPDSDQKIATRLGAADRRVNFQESQPGPFLQPVCELTLRFHQLPSNISPDARPEHIAIMPANAGFEFNLGQSRYSYDRFGLQRLRVSA